jgi:hypothetical protein
MSGGCALSTSLGIQLGAEWRETYRRRLSGALDLETIENTLGLYIHATDDYIMLTSFN